VVNGRFEIIDRTANLSRMTILDTGDVGIGTSGPFGKVDIVDNANRLQIGGLGCGSGGIGIAVGTSAATDCTTYALLGNGTDTFLNAPTNLKLRVGNTNIATLTAGHFTVDLGSDRADVKQRTPRRCVEMRGSSGARSPAQTQPGRVHLCVRSSC